MTDKNYYVFVDRVFNELPSKMRGEYCNLLLFDSVFHEWLEAIYYARYPYDPEDIKYIADSFVVVNKMMNIMIKQRFANAPEFDFGKIIKEIYNKEEDDNE